jgi:hypothetical protein
MQGIDLLTDAFDIEFVTLLFYGQALLIFRKDIY